MKISLFGDIVSDDYVWLYELFGIQCCSPRNVRDAMKDLPEDEDLVIEINSPGGDVWAGFEIFGLLQTLGDRAEAHIVVMAASAATTVMCGCARVYASPVAQIMVHQPSVSVWFESFNNEGARQLQNFLDSIKASIINSYVVKCGGKTSRKKLEQLVDDSTWMPAQDAISLGLVDGYLDTDEERDALISAGGGIGVSNALSANTPKALLERYEAAVKAGTMPEDPQHPVKRESAQSAPEAAQGEDQAVIRGVDMTTAPDSTNYAVGVPGEDPVITENREIVENLIDNWRLQAAIDLERARDAE